MATCAVVSLVMLVPFVDGGEGLRGRDQDDLRLRVLQPGVLGQYGRPLTVFGMCPAQSTDCIVKEISVRRAQVALRDVSIRPPECGSVSR
ncbi:hypothetical protein EFN05_02080 [Propionibacterium freudenreichii]|nr:hypothetical protein BMR99_09605 [Propionibacterium freudenreichii]PWN00127.1 MAG: hypothetical protein DBX96_00790 [Propionibacterium sp.]MCT2988020.1 hypothetical protein [Propionibacterium freudenreichii]MCT3010853.1 hypothetical protein [Propionibacterium freudenreichii]MCT3013834.1 hypothetical protein [Propionibacterium freudenreichii]